MSNLLQLGQHFLHGLDLGRILGADGRHPAIRLVERLDPAVIDVAFHKPPDVVGRDHDIVDDGTQQLLNRLAVLELLAEAHGAGLQRLDLAADGAQVGLEGGEIRLDRLQHLVARLDASVQVL